ncbi:UNVERIFIED_CONTAM: hypothetical protein FKN15_006226 [Acipenser sinensis]
MGKHLSWGENWTCGDHALYFRDADKDERGKVQTVRALPELPGTAREVIRRHSSYNNSSNVYDVVSEVMNEWSLDSRTLCKQTSDGSNLYDEIRTMEDRKTVSVYTKINKPKPSGLSPQPGAQGDDSRYRNAALFLNGRLPTVPGMNCPTIQYEARSSCCTVPSPVEREIVDLDSFALCHRQKQQISQLEQKVRESELQVHSALIGRNPSYNDVYLLRLQEAQRENTFLRAQFADQTSSFNKEKAEAERKLAAVEAEVRKLSETLKETTQKHSEEMKKQEERVRGRDKHINSLKKKCQKESEQNREKQQRIETLERYLADLPTLEDYQKQSNQLKELERQSGQLQDTVSDLERKLGEARAQCRERAAQLESQKEKELELISQVHSLQEKVEQSLEDGDRLPMLDMEKLKAENNSLKEEVERAKGVIEKQQKKMEQIASQIRRLEEQVIQEEGTSQALREDLTEKENGLQQLRKAMKEVSCTVELNRFKISLLLSWYELEQTLQLSAQNQELIERNLTLQEQLGQPGQCEAPQAGSSQLTQRLHGEMAACLYDLQSLCNILNQRSQGRDPNLSLLLGIRSMQYSCDDREDWMNPEVLAKKLTEVQQLRRDVEELRTTMSDRYAQDMGDNCITQ